RAPTPGTPPLSLHAALPILRAVTTANDGSADSAAYSSDEVTVANSKPVITSVSYSPASPKVGDTLTASGHATDADNDTVTYSYQDQQSTSLNSSHRTIAYPG